MSINDGNLIWIDLEMTGLDPEKEKIIEIATIVTDKDLNVLAYGPEIIINQPKRLLDAMDEWCTKQHAKTGLTEAVLLSEISTATAESETLKFLQEWVPSGVSPICGNSVGQDRRFLFKEMPVLERFFHYRTIDVSTIKELARRWKPKALEAVHKRGGHRAMDDIVDSIEELKTYREYFFKL